MKCDVYEAILLRDTATDQSEGDSYHQIAPNPHLCVNGTKRVRNARLGATSLVLC